GNATNAAKELWCFDHLYHARPDDRVSYRQIDHRAVPRRGDGGRRCGYGDQTAAASLHTPAGRFDPLAGSEPALGRDRNQSERIRIIRSKYGLQIHGALPLRDGQVPDTATAVSAEWASSGLVLSLRAEPANRSRAFVGITAGVIPRVGLRKPI